MKNQKNILRIVAAISLAGTLALGQGSLTPSGAPSETMKTLQQVEPRVDVATLPGDAASEFIINDAGSYYLSSSMEVTKTYGILINSTDVTLDLNGFEIVRSSGSGGDGIRIVAGADRLTVRNGILTGFAYGIRTLSGPYAKGCRFENLNLAGHSNRGIDAGESTLILNCIAGGNGNYGLIARLGSTIRGCVAFENGFAGIRASHWSAITDCQSYANAGIGIMSGLGATIADCAVYKNEGQYGILAEARSVVRNCESYENVGSGSSSYGIYANTGSKVIGCTSRENSNTNSPSTSNQGVGIFCASEALVENNFVSLNQGDGIYVTNDTVIRGNVCKFAGHYGGDGAGIHTLTANNEVDSNSVANSDRGIHVESSGHLIIRNTARGNGTNYQIVNNNKVGVIVSAPASGAISGSTGGAGVGTTYPWANFSF